MRLVVLTLALFASPIAAQEPDLSGKWSGRWQSETTRHSGPLNATFTRTGPSEYRVVFTGRFFAVVPFRYAQKLEVTGTAGDTVFLGGSSRLIGFGTFHYDAAASEHDFKATFRSRGDSGVFLLGR